MDNARTPNDSRINAYLALASGILAISTGAVLIRLADAPSLTIAAYRVGIAALILMPVAMHKARPEIRRLSATDWKIALLAGFFLAMHFATWVASLKFTSVANSVVLVNTSPIWVGIFAPVITREKIRTMMMMSILLSVLGTMVIGMGDYATGGKALWGDCLALTGGLYLAGYLLMGRRLRQKLSLIAYVSVCYGSAAMILWSVVLLMGIRAWGFSNQTVTALISMALVPQLIGHSCYNWALKYFSTGFVAVTLLGEPIGSVFLAYILLHEGLTAVKVIGGIFILAGICAAATSENR